ncbi:DUF3558 domain-containing protein [Nocardia sp. NPDC049190]|uniref:DUF3558 domain-containing protein n=1 Tax=Nocardia sp. NPDC049190 TaxID=3155650 RepID=UPI0033E72234
MTSWGNTLRGTALAVGAVLALAGCKGTTDGAATSITSDATTASDVTKSADPDAALWNPCELPESAISATGLDPASKEKDVAGVDFTGWKVCGWRSSTRWYDLTIFSGSPKLEDIRQRRDYEAFTPRSVGSHQAVEFLDVGDRDRLKCGFAVEVPRGSVAFRVVTRPSIGKQGEPCVQVRSHVEDLAQYLPGS